MGYLEEFESKALDLFLWVREQIRLMDHLGASAKGNEKRLMGAHFLLSSRYEFLFWDQAYRMEEWPV